MKKEKTKLLKLLKKHSFKKGRVRLSSGKTSNYYIDGKLTTLTAEGAYLTAKIILRMIKRDRIKAIGGLTLGADPIVSATAALSFSTPNPLNAFIVRKEPKKHGLQKFIEGPPFRKNARIVVVDDVVTSGGSTIKAINAIRTAKGKVVKALAIVDRLEGAEENLAKVGVELVSIYTSKDLLKNDKCPAYQTGGQAKSK
ncbi:MAG: orotate phosphoribosyltransferase [Candidatus Omnitrophota bacterium]